MARDVDRRRHVSLLVMPVPSHAAAPYRGTPLLK
jgi:hypothetical protein